MDFFTLVGLNVVFYFLICVIILWFTDCDLQLNFADKFGKKLVKLRGKVVWITGATTDLSSTMALAVIKHGGRLALTSDSPKDLEKLKARCLRMNPSMRSRDILISSDCHKIVLAKIIRHFGTLDILIMNEDKWEKSIWEETTSATDREIFQSNVCRVVTMARSVVRYFSFKQRGTLAVISSIAGLIGIPHSGSYAGAKHALHGYFNSLRIEKLGEHIQVTILCLGSIDLPRKKFSEAMTTGKKKMLTERCAHLCLTAIINDLDEGWMAAFPVLYLVYGMKYFPNFTKLLLKYLTPKKERNLKNHDVPFNSFQ